MTVLLTIVEITSIVFVSIASAASCFILVFTRQPIFFIPIILVFCGLSIVCTLIFFQYQKALIKCFGTITEDVHKIAEKECKEAQ